MNGFDENIVLHVYGELADDARHELEQHVARCADCAAELKAEQEFHALLSQDRAVDPTPNLLAASRMRLQEALETAPQGRFWSRLPFDPAIGCGRCASRRRWRLAILILGFAGGVAATYKTIGPHPHRLAQDRRAMHSDEASIAGINSITQDPELTKSASSTTPFYRRKPQVR